MSKPILEGLNAEQLAAVRHTGGALLILAGAGSGKTRVITRRFAHLAQKSPADSILAVTFTNKAAREMRERISPLVKDDLKGAWIGTFHSQCCRILRREIEALGYKRDFSIYDTSDQHSLIRHILKEMSVYEALYKGILSRIGGLKAAAVTPERFLAEGDSYGFEERLARVYVRYQDELKRCNSLDFDDLIMLTIELFEKHPEVLARYRGKFRHLLVDEFQDTNLSQYRLVKLLAGDGADRDICVVGDDDQCIYGFRGAQVNNILGFEKDFPNTTVIKLEQNYRSTSNILSVSGSLIECNQKRHAKKLWCSNDSGEKVSRLWFANENDEAEYIAKSMRELYLKGSYDYRDFAVLYRVNIQSKSIEDALRREGFPYRVVGGTSFYHRKEVKDVTAYLRLTINRNDNVSLRRVINTPPRGIGASTIAKVEQEAKKKNLSLFESMRNLTKAGAVTAAVKEKVVSFMKLIDELGSDNYVDAAQFMNAIYTKTGYAESIDEDRAQNVRDLIDGGRGRDVLDFADSLSLVSTETEEAEAVNSVSLMTLHSAKGLEFPVVFITGLEEGVLPHFKAQSPQEIDEERRLLYVGMTRAKERLCLTGARLRRMYSKTQEQEPSRFLEGIPAATCVSVDKIRETPAAAGVRKKLKTFKPAYAYAVGTRVRHPKWGVGVVRDCYGDGDDQKITVNFPVIGVKRLALKFAHLEHIRT